MKVSILKIRPWCGVVVGLVLLGVVDDGALLVVIAICENDEGLANLGHFIGINNLR